MTSYGARIKGPLLSADSMGRDVLKLRYYISKCNINEERMYGW